MSGIDDKRYFKKAREQEGTPVESNSNKSDYYGMNIATFTFGGKQPHMMSNQLNLMNKESEFDDMTIKPKFRKTNSSKRFEIDKEKDKYKDREREREIILDIEKSKLLKGRENSHSSIPINCNIYSPAPGIINKIGAHNSFLSVVVQSLWNFSIFRNFVLNELHVNSEKDIKNKLLYELKCLFKKFTQLQIPGQSQLSKNDLKKIDISRLRITLAEVFQNRRKFLIDQPDDPIDCFFAFINATHSYEMKNSLNEVIDTLCTSKCPSHKNFWIDLCRIEDCECKGSSKRFYSHHNYIFDVPLDKIFQLSNNLNLIEMSKSFKLKTGKFSQVGSTELANITDLKGKLFLYFKTLMNQIKVDCPAKGIRCEINKTTKNLFLNNLPNYLSFALQRKFLNTVTEILKTYILIPKLFDLSTLFDHSSKQKVFFEFFGAICIKPGKTYTCFFKNLEASYPINSMDVTYNWTHYDDEKVTNFSSWFELISHCLKNMESPLMIFFQIQEKYSDNEKELTTDELQTLERYARNADNLPNILQNRFRSDEEIINYELDLNFVNDNNENLQHLLKRQKQSSKYSTSISTSKPNSTNNSNSRIEHVTEYICSKCLSKNRIENQICSVCCKNNEDVIEDLLKKKGMNNFINIENFNLNINTGVDKEKEKDIKLSSLKKNDYINSNSNVVINPFVEGKVLAQDREFISDDSEGEMDKFNNRKNYNMPKQIVNKKETPVTIKVKEINSINKDIQNKNENASVKYNTLGKNQNVRVALTGNIEKKNIVVGKDKGLESFIVNDTNKDNYLKANVNSQIEINKIVKKPSILDEKDSKNDKNEDRILPYELIKKKSKNNIQITPNTINNDAVLIEKWKCLNCNTHNKKLDTRCIECNHKNTNNKELCRGESSSNNEALFNNSIKRMNSYKESIKSPNSEDNIKQMQSLERRTSEKKSSNTYNYNSLSSNIANNINKSNINNNTPNENTHNLHKCLCYTNICTDNLIKNKVCLICNRYVENTPVLYENLVKKKYQQDLQGNSNPTSNNNMVNHNQRNKNRNSNQNILKRNDSFSKHHNKEDSMHLVNNKIRCPSSNPNSSKPNLNTYNRYKDIFIDHPEDDLRHGNSNYLSSNPTSSGHVKVRSKINSDGNINNYKNIISSNYNSNSSTHKLQSTSKKKVK